MTRGFHTTKYLYDMYLYWPFFSVPYLLFFFAHSHFLSGWHNERPKVSFPASLTALPTTITPIMLAIAAIAAPMPGRELDMMGFRG